MNERDETMSECLFCRIASGVVPTALVWQDDSIVAFRDINPQCPVHVLLIPRKHITSLSELSAQDDAIIGRLVRVSGQIAGREGVAATGYRLVANCGREAGQSVDHVHFHLLGGRPMHWPPG
jgi:histidine triad (HIT) family protein